MKRLRRGSLHSGALSPLTISLTYALISVAWILLSDRLTDLIPDRSVAMQVQSVKGIGFVLVTTALMFGLIVRYRSRLVEAAEQLAERRSDLMWHASTLTPVFQPVVDLATGETVGFEALSRFEDGTPPAQRFAQAAELGVGPDLEAVAIQRALARAADLPDGCWLSLNVSASLLREHDRLAELVAHTDRPLVLELTEQEAISDYVALRQVVEALGPHVSLAIDDIGEAFSGLRHLVELMPAYAKLDMGLVRDIHVDPARQALVAALRRYMDEVGAVLIAEGVESEAEGQMLTSLGVALAQGFLFGRPAPVADPTPAGPGPAEPADGRDPAARDRSRLRNASAGSV